MDQNLSALTTEQRNQDTLNIDKVSTVEMLEMINDEDAKAAAAVRLELPNIARAVEAVAKALGAGGRLFYVGAGTSGRIGVLDASEIPPTFGLPHGIVVGVMAGGESAMYKAKEGAEDNPALGAKDIEENGVKAGDIVMGIAASGRTPYVLGALEGAKKLGALTIGLSNVAGSKVSQACDIPITPVPGPEALTGSTRMKAGTTQKMVLNMITTGAMIKLGKAYSNLMVDVVPTNEKLVDRAARIVHAATGADLENCAKTLIEAGNNPKTAIVMIKTGLGGQEARGLLERCGGFVARALETV